MKAWIFSSIVVAIFLSGILFYPRNQYSPEQTKQIHDEYIRLLEERNEVLKQYLELLELQKKMQEGKAWAA